MIGRCPAGSSIWTNLLETKKHVGRWVLVSQGRMRYVSNCHAANNQHGIKAKQMGGIRSSRMTSRDRFHTFPDLVQEMGFENPSSLVREPATPRHDSQSQSVLVSVYRIRESGTCVDVLCCQARAASAHRASPSNQKPSV